MNDAALSCAHAIPLFPGVMSEPLPNFATPRRGAALAAIALQTIIAATTFVVAKAALTAFRPLELAGLRMIGAAVVMGALAAPGIIRRRAPVAKYWRELALLGVIGVMVNQVCFLSGLARSTPTHAALLYALTPAFVHLFALAGGDERPRLARGAGILLALSGAVVIIAGPGRHDSGGTLRGDLLILAGVIAWAAYSARARPVVRALGALRFTALTLVAGAIAGLPVVAPALSGLSLAAISAEAWMGLAFLIVFTSAIAYALWTFALRGLEATQVAISANAQPVLTAILSHLVLDEPIGFGVIAGGALVISGVALTQTQFAAGRAAA